MFRARAGFTAWLYLTSIRNIVAEFRRVFIVYRVNFFRAEGANLTPGDISCPALSATPRSAES